MNGKAKGSAFERWTARELSLWLTGGKEGKQLIRSVLSGGWSAGQQDRDFRQVGDLAPNGPAGERFRQKFAVECKHRREIDLYGVWTRKDALVEWWEKLLGECKRAKVAPMLIFRSNRCPTMVGMKKLPAGIQEYAYFSRLGMYVFSFEAFLTTVTPQDLGV